MEKKENEIRKLKKRKRDNEDNLDEEIHVTKRLRSERDEEKNDRKKIETEMTEKMNKFVTNYIRYYANY